MNREFNGELNGNYNDTKYCRTIEKELLDKIDEQQNKINKVIDKINWYNEEVLGNPKCTIPPFLNELLSILKGENNE